MKERHNSRTAGASLPVVLAMIVIVVCLILLIVPQFIKQDNTQMESVILGYERTARNAAREAFTLGSDSLGKGFDKDRQVAFIVDSKGKRIYALEEKETLAELVIRLREAGVPPIENYGEELMFTSPDPWQTRYVGLDQTSGGQIPGSFYIGEEITVGHMYDLRNCILFVSVREGQENQYQYHLWWQDTGATKLLKQRY